MGIDKRTTTKIPAVRLEQLVQKSLLPEEDLEMLDGTVHTKVTQRKLAAVRLPVVELSGDDLEDDQG